MSIYVISGFTNRQRVYLQKKTGLARWTGARVRAINFTSRAEAVAEFREQLSQDSRIINHLSVLDQHNNVVIADTIPERDIPLSLPSFGELYADMIKRNHVNPNAKRAVERFAGLEAVYAGVDTASKPSRTAILVKRVRDEMAAEAQPLAFSVDSNRCGFPAHDLQETVRRARMGWKLKPNRPLVGSDFASYDNRILLAELGYFSCDLPAARAKRDRAAQIEAYIDEAYDMMHLDRKQQHALIAARLEAKRFDGIWARSTGEYAAACRRLDDAMLAWNPAIALSVAELRGTGQ